MNTSSAAQVGLCLILLTLSCAETASNDPGLSTPEPTGPATSPTPESSGGAAAVPPAADTTPSSPSPGVSPPGMPTSPLPASTPVPTPSASVPQPSATGGGAGAAPVQSGGAAPTVGGGGATGGGGAAPTPAGGAGPGGAAGAEAGTGGTGGAATIGPEVTVQLGMLRQVMAGFGINNNWSPAMTDAVADRLFGTEEGQLGLTILRIGMNPEGQPYNGANCWSDIEKASARGVQYFIGTLWSPPARMKSNNSITGGGHLLPEYYEEWSDTIVAFPGLVKQNTGVDLYGMSPQNETDFASCGFDEPCNGNYDTTVFTGREYAELAAIVGPKLHALDPPVKMIAPEASEWIHVWSNESGCCSEPGGLGSSDPLDCGFPATNPACDDYNGYDYGHALFNHPTAWQYVDILGTHQYDTQVAEPWPADVPDKKPVWQTEMSGVKWWKEQGPSTHIENGVAVARWIHNALTVGEASAWLWWWYQALGDTNEGLLLADGTETKRMWTLGNYSRFIRPEYTRVEVTGEIPASVLLTAFAGPAGTVVVVAVNEDTAAAELPITIAGGTAPAELSRWVTSASDDLAAQAPVAVTDGIFTASLPAMSVTTFVGN